MHQVRTPGPDFLFSKVPLLLKVGLTGGIGAGKTIVGRVFAAMGVPVFNADETAKMLMETDPAIHKGVIDIIGNDAFVNGKLNRGYISGVIFKDAAKLEAFNKLVHPATIQYGIDWMEAHKNDPYIIKEAAILFETGSNKQMDKVIGVTADQEERIQRAMLRNNQPREKVEAIIAKQMPDAEKMSLCDFVIINDGEHAVIPQVLAIHRVLMRE